MNKCECGQPLAYTVSPFMTAEKRVCPKCGKVHYAEDNRIDWANVNKELTINKSSKNSG